MVIYIHKSETSTVNVHMRKRMPQLYGASVRRTHLINVDSFHSHAEKDRTSQLNFLLRIREQMEKQSFHMQSTGNMLQMLQQFPQLNMHKNENSA